MLGRKELFFIALFVALGAPIVLAHPALAASTGEAQTADFIRSIIKVITGFAGLIGTGAFVIGGILYMTSSGNPERIDKGKQTMVWAAIGLGIVIGAYALTNVIVTYATGSFGSN